VDPQKDQFFMRLALLMAKRGEGWVSPNPMVGAVLVKDSRILSKGFHRFYGGDHAEVDAIKRAKEPLEGATLYVNLEPCSHWGKTPPCTDAIIKAGIRRVVIANRDPNPLVNGKGIEILKRHGIQVEIGVLEEEGRALNRAYFKYYEEHSPFITLKWAQTLDGKIATSTGDSKWISSQRALRFAHKLRAIHQAVVVGIGTVLKDDPQLTVRLVRGRNPLRVVLDSGLRIPLDSKVLNVKEAPLLIATTQRADPEKMALLQERGVEVLRLGEERVELRELLNVLYERKIQSVLVEGGRGVLTSFLKEGLCDRLTVIISPKLMGEGLSPFGDLGIRKIEEALPLKEASLKRIGSDWIFEGYLR